MTSPSHDPDRTSSSPHSSGDSSSRDAWIARWEQQGARFRRGKSGKLRAADFRACGSDFGDDEARHLARLSDLIRLELAGTAVGDKTLESVKSLAGLSHLDLQQTAITSAGLVHLETLTRLKLLLLTGTDVDRESLKPLRQKLLGTRIVLAASG